MSTHGLQSLSADERLSYLGLDDASKAEVLQRWEAVQERIAAMHSHLLSVEAGPLDHWLWLVRKTVERGQERATAAGSAGGASNVLALGRRFRSGEVSPREFVNQTIARIAQGDPQIHSVVALAPDAHEAAERSTKRLRDGDGRELLGIPFGIKDVADRMGMATTAGCRGWPSVPAGRTAAAIRRLEEAGAIFLAKLSTPELSCGSAVNELLGTVANPHDRSRWSGGSSAGPAAAIAAGFLPMAVGEDTGGSIRLPAAHCGIVGLRPTFGRVPRSGFIPVAWSMDQPGPMAATVSDVALTIEVLAGHDPDDPFSLNAPPPRYRSRLGRDVAGLRAGVVRNWFLDDIDNGVRQRFEDCLSTLQRLGCELRDVELPTAALTTAGVWAIIRSEFATLLVNRPEVLAGTEVETRRRAGVGLLISAVDYLAAQRFRRMAQAEFETVCQQVDLVLTPAAPSTAGYIRDGEAWIDINGERRPWNDSARMTAHFGFINCPALVVPFGKSKHDGLPVGVQLAGMPDSEPVLLQVGQAIESSQ